MFLESNFNFFVFFFIACIFIAVFIVKFSNKLFFGLLIDKDFNKPQAFHKQAIARSGGFLITTLFFLFIFFFFNTSKIFLTDYFFITLLFFVLGFLDDVKIKINPNIRLMLMFVILIIFIKLFSIEINLTGLGFLNYWLENEIFQIFFVILCFLFIINGSNLVDGFNGLLAIQFLIINTIYLAINIININYNFSLFLLGQIIIVLSFLIFNFPKAKIFLGDSGSYVLGVLIALNTIKTHLLNIEIYPFFFTSILFYLFFEVFFSFLRKLKAKTSPLKPDEKHLHMLLYFWLKKIKKIKNSNYLTSLILNIFYIILIIPVLLFKDNALFCRYWFFSLLVIYIVFYFRLYSLYKK